MKKLLFVAILSALAFSAYYHISAKNKSITQEDSNLSASAFSNEIILPEDSVVNLIVSPGTTYIELMKAEGIEYGEAILILETAKDNYDLAKIREGNVLRLTYDEFEILKELNYKINTENELFITRQNDMSLPEWTAEVKPIPYEVQIKTVSAEIKTSMYQAALDNEIDIRAVIELANAFQWTIDFAMDPRVGDTFSFVYEARYLNDEYAMPGKVLAGKYNNAGTEYFVYYFKENEDNVGFFDKDGNSVQKMFLKAPVEFKYISSGFTTGLRYIKAFNVSTGHRAIDYAAPMGTPIRSVGDGTIISAGWNNQGYGNFTSIRHNSTYTTNYAHQSKIVVKRGQKVKQGDVIGYVGSTGFSTGPHLHYEMVKNGVKINPLAEVLPPGEPIKEENRERFFAEVEKYEGMLK